MLCFTFFNTVFVASKSRSLNVEELRAYRFGHVPVLDNVADWISFQKIKLNGLNDGIWRLPSQSFLPKVAFGLSHDVCCSGTIGWMTDSLQE